LHVDGIDDGVEAEGEEGVLDLYWRNDGLEWCSDSGGLWSFVHDDGAGALKKLQGNLFTNITQIWQAYADKRTQRAA
jgi:hypothetical protein